MFFSGAGMTISGACATSTNYESKVNWTCEDCHAEFGDDETKIPQNKYGEKTCPYCQSHKFEKMRQNIELFKQWEKAIDERKQKRGY
jgi:DNA-directed RNA polymerase subunit RPC12/RpoP